MEIKEIPLIKIMVGERFRTDYGDIPALAAAIQAKGLLQPIGVNEKNQLLWGGRRLAAYKELKLKSIPAVVRKGADPLDKIECELFENTDRKELTWQERAANERAIKEYKLKKDPNWSERKQAESKGESQPQVSRRIRLAEAMENIPEIADAKTEKQAWKLLKRIEEDAAHTVLQKKALAEHAEAAVAMNNHYVIKDCFAGMEEIKAASFHFIECDPPYGIELQAKKSRNADTATTVDRYNEIPVKEYPAFFKRLAEESHRLLKNDSFAIFWFGMDWYQMCRDTLGKVGFSVNPIPAIWYKGTAGQTASPDTMLGSSYETFLVARKGSPKLRIAGRSNVFHYAPMALSKKIHTTQKPLELMEEILKTFCFTGSQVLIPFLGSGVTLYAAYRLQMLGHGFDLDKVIKTRAIAWVQEQEAAGKLGVAQMQKEKSNEK